MATIKFTLTDGLTVGKTINKDVELREVSAGDLIDATEDAERVVLTGEGYQLLTSPTMVGLHTLCRQIVRIGDHPGPLTIAELKKLSGRDLNMIQDEANKLDQATLAEATDKGKKP